MQIVVLVFLLFILLGFGAKHRSDPAYVGEFSQVYDAGLRGVIVVDNLQSNEQILLSNKLTDVMTERLNFKAVSRVNVMDAFRANGANVLVYIPSANSSGFVDQVEHSKTAENRIVWTDHPDFCSCSEVTWGFDAVMLTSSLHFQIYSIALAAIDPHILTSQPILPSINYVDSPPTFLSNIPICQTEDAQENPVIVFVPHLTSQIVELIVSQSDTWNSVAATFIILQTTSSISVTAAKGGQSLRGSLRALQERLTRNRLVFIDDCMPSSASLSTARSIVLMIDISNPPSKPCSEMTSVIQSVISIKHFLHSSPTAVTSSCALTIIIGASDVDKQVAQQFQEEFHDWKIAVRNFDGIQSRFPLEELFSGKSLNRNARHKKAHFRESYLLWDNWKQAAEDSVIGIILSRSFRSFVRSNLKAIREVSIQDPRSNSKAANVQNSGGKLQGRQYALIIEPRIDFAFEFVVKNTLFRLGESWGLIVFFSAENERFVLHCLSDLKVQSNRTAPIIFFELPQPVFDGNSYNNLLKSEQFWSMTAGEPSLADQVLIFQTDSLILKSSGIDTFLKYDYIGAPWPIIDEKRGINNKREVTSCRWLQQMQRRGVLLEGVGNGGLSLRNVKLMQQISREFGWKSKGTNEDTFFMSHLERLSRGGGGGGGGGEKITLPSRQDAYKFARELTCVDLEENTNNNTSNDSSNSSSSSSSKFSNKSTIPWAIHSAWSYLPFEDIQNLLSHVSIA